MIGRKNLSRLPKDSRKPRVEVRAQSPRLECSLQAMNLAWIHSRLRRASSWSRAIACSSLPQQEAARPSSVSLRSNSSLLHDPDQSPQQPEVSRPLRTSRPRQHRAVDWRQCGQWRCAGCRHDDRGSTEHAVRRIHRSRHAVSCSDGRGPLLGRPSARGGLGGGHPPPARANHLGGTVRDCQQR